MLHFVVEDGLFFRLENPAQAMPDMMQHVYYFWAFYKNFFLRAWHNITPAQYGLCLVAVAVIGYLLMKSGAKSTT